MDLFFQVVIVGIPLLVGIGIWAYAIKRLGILLGISIGWIPGGITAIFLFYFFVPTLLPLFY